MKEKYQKLFLATVSTLQTTPTTIPQIQHNTISQLKKTDLLLHFSDALQIIGYMIQITANVPIYQPPGTTLLFAEGTKPFKNSMLIITALKSVFVW